MSAFTPMAVLLLPVVLTKERTDPAGGVVAARGVAKERIDSAGGVVAACGVAKKRIGSVGGVVTARGVVKLAPGPHWQCCCRPWCC